jgi:hypothetical protein
MNPDERATRRGLMWAARILIGLMLTVLIAGFLRWLLGW